MSLYSDDVGRFIKSYPWPVGNRLAMNIEEEFTVIGQEVLVIKIYRDNFNTFSGEEQMMLASIFNDLIPSLIAKGIPTRLVVAQGDGRGE